jgi:hypothetical protein
MEPPSLTAARDFFARARRLPKWGTVVAAAGHQAGMSGRAAWIAAALDFLFDGAGSAI